MVSTLNRDTKLNFLEGVRGTAALVVVLHHLGLIFFPAINYLDKTKTHLGEGKLEMLIAGTPLSIFFNGSFAVCVFFVLSGFVLSHKFHQRGDKNILKEYAVKRYFRLLIPVAVIILICYLLSVFNLFTIHSVDKTTSASEWLGGIFLELKGPLDALKNIFVDVFFNNDNRYNPVLWTMTIELMGSFLLFGFLALCSSETKKSYWLHIIVVVVILMMEKKIYACFIFGSLLSKLYTEGFSLKVIWNVPLKILLLLIGLYFSTYPHGNFVATSIWRYLEWPGYDMPQLVHVTGAFCIMFVICFSNGLKSFFALKPWVYLGKISFSFYLLHFPIICALGTAVFGYYIQSAGYLNAFLLACAASIPLTFVLAHFYHKWVDKKGIVLAEWIGKRV